MGLSHVEAASQAARLTRQPVAEIVGPGHGRGKTPPPDKTDTGLRGVPVIGHGSGAIAGTSPGGELGAGARLEQAGRELVRARLHRNRFKKEERA